MIRDERGQWIILAGFTISISLAILIVLLNLSFMSGYHSSQAQIEFPMYELRELYDETEIVVNTAAMNVNYTNDPSDDPIADADVVNDTMMNFGNFLSQLYAYHGQLVQVSVNTTTNNTGSLNITRVVVSLAFDDGVTQYTEHLESER
ncbi:hypothetical protein DRN77_06610 [Methanosarcinales archaeon]|nr:MAG: hypothetical protein DRN77_06610 [Methanosarcinales archaeon]